MPAADDTGEELLGKFQHTVENDVCDRFCWYLVSVEICKIIIKN